MNGKKLNTIFVVLMAIALILCLFFIGSAFVAYGGLLSKYESDLYFIYPLIFFSSAVIILKAYGKLYLYRGSKVELTKRRIFWLVGITVVAVIEVVIPTIKAMFNFSGLFPDDVCERLTASWIGFLLGSGVVFLVGLAFKGEKKSEEV